LQGKGCDDCHLKMFSLNSELFYGARFSNDGGVGRSARR
jgi:hypothetical protein